MPTKTSTSRGRRTTTRKTAKKRPARRAAARKSTTRKPKATSRKRATKKTAKRTTAKKTARKATARKTGARKTARKATRKSTTRKTTRKTAPAGIAKISGPFKGDIVSAGTLQFEPTANASGKIKGVDVSIKGSFSGSVNASKTIKINKGAKVKGSFNAGKFFIDNGASFDGRVRVTKRAA